MENIKALEAYAIEEMRPLEELGGQGLRLRHRKTGARVLLISNQDPNKVFFIGFATPPADSTGLPHILEHSVLCGSRNFPCKDPFVELAKGSLNTFLNAMTYPDKTLYPVASCNAKDFHNLIHVYMDAVFYPNIAKYKEIFAQEGWHYSLENPDAPLEINGVVYNEMKGAFSSPEEILAREMFNSLFPDTAYGHESGGDPARIPDLRYEDFLNFHQKYYHPSNSYIYLYGNGDMAAELDFLDREYLRDFAPGESFHHIDPQTPFDQPLRISRKYSVEEGEEAEDRAFFGLSLVPPLAGAWEERVLETLAFQVLDHCLGNSSSGSLRKRFLEEGLCKDMYTSYDEGLAYPYFAIVAKNAKGDADGLFEELVWEELERISREGLEERAWRAAISHMEFRYRESDYGSYPKGLILGLHAMDSWMVEDGAAFAYLEMEPVFAKLREEAAHGYFRDFVSRKFFGHRHMAYICLLPEAGLAAREEAERSARLEAAKAALSPGDLERICEEQAALEAYQGREERPEDLARLPMLSRRDLDRRGTDPVNTLESLEGRELLFHGVESRGIVYLRLLFDLEGLHREELRDLGLLKLAFASVDAGDLPYARLGQEIDICTGGIGANIISFTHGKQPGLAKNVLELKTKYFYHQAEEALALLRKVALESDFSNVARLREIVGENKARWEAYMISSGHSIAVSRLGAYGSQAGAFRELFNGWSFYQSLCALEKELESRGEAVAARLEALSAKLVCRARLGWDLACEPAYYSRAMEQLLPLARALPQGEPASGKGPVLEQPSPGEGFFSQGMVQYVGKGGNFRQAGLEYSGTLQVLKNILSYEYLWGKVRVMGGAYGCMCGFGRTGEGYFVSYRDPHLLQTLENFDSVADFVENFAADERAMTQYVIGAISALDTPMTPYVLAAFSMGAYYAGLGAEDLQKEREEILDARAEDIQALAGHVQALLSQGHICVVGNAQKLQEQAALFGRLEKLF